MSGGSETSPEIMLIGEYHATQLEGVPPFGNVNFGFNYPKREQLPLIA